MVDTKIVKFIIAIFLDVLTGTILGIGALLSIGSMALGGLITAMFIWIPWVLAQICLRSKKKKRLVIMPPYTKYAFQLK